MTEMHATPLAADCLAAALAHLADHRARSGTARAGRGVFRSLRHRNARVFFAGMLVSTIGTWLQITAMSLLVYDLTGRATDLGITVALQFLPTLLLGAWAGAIADRRDRRTLAIALNAGLALQAAVLGLLDLAGWVNVPVVWGLTLAMGCSTPSRTRPAAAS